MAIQGIFEWDDSTVETADGSEPDDGILHPDVRTDTGDDDPDSESDGEGDGDGAGDLDVNDTGQPDTNVDSAPEVVDLGDEEVFDPCSDAAKLIYVVDAHDEALYSFNPLDSTFTMIAEIDCNTGSSTPYSMAISRDADAFILFQNDNIYQVNTETGACQPTPYVSGQRSRWYTFGMGYAMNSRDAEEDTLFIGNASYLGSIDLDTWTVTDIGRLDEGNPELAGTAWGELWGFFPHSSKIAQIDKTNGQFINTYDLPLSSDANAWAFAFWGGYFYIFYKTFSDNSTNVYRMSIEGGDLEMFSFNTGRYIVGAGVSTCAPVKWPGE